MNNITSRRAFATRQNNAFAPAQSLKPGVHPLPGKPVFVPGKPNALNKENNTANKFGGAQIKAEPKFGAQPIKVESKVSHSTFQKPSAIPVAKNGTGIPMASSRFMKRSHSELQAVQKTFQKLQVTPKIENIDKLHNANFMTDYAADVYKYLAELETRWAVPQGFMKVHNPGMSSNHRSMIVNWIFRFERMFEVTPDTFHIATAIFDRFIHATPLTRGEYQCVAVTAFYIACKFEEVYFPTLGDLVHVCENLYSKADFIAMELRILSALKFDLGRPHALQFLRRFSRAAKANSRTHTMAKYFSDLSLAYYQLAHIKPSMIAASALYISIRLNQEPTGRLTPQADPGLWTPTLEHYSTYTRDQLAPCVELMAYIILNSETAKEQECRKKFSSTKFGEVAKLSATSKKILEALARKSISP